MSEWLWWVAGCLMDAVGLYELYELYCLCCECDGNGNTSGTMK